MSKLQYVLYHPKLQQRIDQNGGKIDVPSLPIVFMKLRQVINDPAGDAHKAAAVIENDPAITMRLLKLVNSAAYGLRNPVHKVEQAIALLGFREIANLVLASTVIHQFPVKSGDRTLDIRKFWEHCIGVAVCARVLSRYVSRLPPAMQDECFLAGLVHDSGKLILHQTWNQEFTAVLNLCKAEKLTMQMAEERIFGFNHQDAGAYLADQWGFSRNTVKAIEVHNTPEILERDDESFRFVSLIHLANILAHYLQFGSGGDPFIPPFYEHCHAILGFKDSDLGTICEEAKVAYAEVTAVISG